MSSVIEEVFRDIKGELQSVLFLPLLLIPPKELSEVFRYVKIAYHDDRTRSELKVVEAFTSFTKIEDPSAIGFHKLITDSIQQKGLDIKNCGGQGYDGAAVMSVKYCTPA